MIDNNNDLSKQTATLLTYLTLMMKGKVYTYEEKLQMVRMLSRIIESDINQRYRGMNTLPPIREREQEDENNSNNKRPRPN